MSTRKKLPSRIQERDLRMMLMARALCSETKKITEVMGNEVDSRECIIKLRAKYVGCFKCGGKRAEIYSGHYGRCTRKSCGHHSPWHYDTILTNPTSAAKFLFAIYMQHCQPNHRDAVMALWEARRAEYVRKPGDPPGRRYRKASKKRYAAFIDWAQQTHTLADLPIDQGDAGLVFGTIEF